MARHDRRRLIRRIRREVEQIARKIHPASRYQAFSSLSGWSAHPDDRLWAAGDNAFSPAQNKVRAANRDFEWEILKCDSLRDLQITGNKLLAAWREAVNMPLTDYNEAA
jgi:hypothetical protein